MKNLSVVHRIIGISFIVVGLISYIFPVPGSTVLVVLGFVWLIGKNKSLSFLRKILGKKIFKSLKIKEVVKDI